MWTHAMYIQMLDKLLISIIWSLEIVQVMDTSDFVVCHGWCIKLLQTRSACKRETGQLPETHFDVASRGTASHKEKQLIAFVSHKRIRG